MSTDQHRILHPIQRLFGEEFNPKLLGSICKRNLPWIGLIFMLSVGSAYLYLRYTPRLYETSATVMVKSENPAKALNIEGIDLQPSNPKKLISQIEVIKSNVILDSVIQVLPLSISYYKKGEILSNELYKSSPFSVEDLHIKKGGIYNRPIHLSFIDEQQYQLYWTQGEKKHTYKGRLGDRLQTPFFDCKIVKQNTFNTYLQKGITDYGFKFMIHTQKHLIRELSRNLSVTPLNRQAGTIRIKYRDDDQKKAADIANTVAQQYLAYDEYRKTKSAQLIMDFIDKQLKKERQSLRQVENKMKQFKMEHQFIDPENAESDILSRFREIEKSLLELRFEKSSLKWLENYIREKKNMVYAAPMLNLKSTRSFSDMVNKLAELQNRKSELLTSVTKESPSVQSVNKKIKEVREALLKSVENAQKSLKAKEKRLLTQREQYSQQFQQLPRKEARYAQLSRINEIREKFYLLLLEKRSQFAITKAGFVSNNVILKQASPPPTPIYPNKMFAWGLGVMGALFLSGFLVLTRYLLHNKILSVSDIEGHTEASLLGVVPSHPHQKEAVPIIFENAPQSTTAEAFRSLRANLQFISPSEGPKTMVITSTIAGEGKTFITLNLATSMALMDKKICLVDFDLRRPQFQHIFDVPNEAGMSTLLIGQTTLKENLQQYKCHLPENFSEHQPILDFIPSGPLPPNPAELVQSDATTKVLQQLQETYDIVLLDTPPIGLVSDALPLLQKADYPIYVLRADYSDRSFLNQINKLVGENQVDQLSLILNDVGAGASGYGYEGYGYEYASENRYTSDSPERKPFWKRLIPG